MESKKIIQTQEERKVKLLCPKIDVVFHALFREENKELLEVLISDVLDEKVTVVTTDKNRYVDTRQAKEKLGIMDLRAELQGGMQCNIEIQLQPNQYANERILYYWADTYRRQLKRGEEYGVLNRTISIVILDHEIEALKGVEKLGVKWQIRDEETGKRVLTDRLEIIIIELPKAKRLYEKNTKNKIIQWMMFLDNPNKKEVVQIMEINKDIRKAIDELEQVSGDEKIQRIAELREKARRDENAAIAYAIEKGLKQGIEQGIERGAKDKSIEIAKKMLKEKMNIETISNITGLSIEEIKALQQKVIKK